MPTLPSIPPASRLLPWEAALNSRELGGYPLDDGRRTRWKALVRSDTLSLLTPAGQQAVLAYGIRTVIDLRFQSELDLSPDPFAALAGSGAEFPDYVHIPLDENQHLDWSPGMEPAAAMSDLYRRLLEANRGHIARVLAATARARPGGVLFHCQFGKDRTGLIAAMFLGALGASADVIAADYAFASAAFADRNRQVVIDAAEPESERGYLQALFTSLPETMRLTLAYLDAAYGGVKGFLATTALAPAALAALRVRMSEHA